MAIGKMLDLFVMLLPTASPDEIEKHLLAMNFSSCGFAHEYRDETFVKQCGKDVQDSFAGCAHSAYLRNAVERLMRLGVLTENKAQTYFQKLQPTSYGIAKLDRKAADIGLGYEVNDGTLRNDHLPFIASRKLIVQELLEDIQHSPVSHSTQKTRLANLPLVQ